MAAPQSSDQYPSQFGDALRAAMSRPEGVLIPSSAAERLRFQFYSYFKALRREGKAELANACMIQLVTESPSTRPTAIRIISRDFSVFAQEIEAALKEEKE